MKFGLQLSSWGIQPPSDTTELVKAAEQAGFDAVFTDETRGSDAYTPLAWLGAATRRIRLGTSVAQLSARTPTACAMAGLTLDHLSGGRHILGLGGSAPEVVEGWYGQPSDAPLARTREYVDILRQVWARERPAKSPGPHYPLPLTSTGTTGLGTAIKSIVHPIRADIPIFLSADGPESMALAAEIADGWLPNFYAPRLADTYNEWLDVGFNRTGARRACNDFDICVTTQLIVTRDRGAAITRAKRLWALRIGDIATGNSIHPDLYRATGYFEAAKEVAALLREGRTDRAASAIPDEFIEDYAIIGDLGYVRDKINMCESAGVTMLLLEHQTVQDISQCGALIST
ncbi:MAG: LLM class F420-dependent oxidoreductase [Mycobacterium sp.]